jgi:hypothetical protein
MRFIPIFNWMQFLSFLYKISKSLKPVKLRFFFNVWRKIDMFVGKIYCQLQTLFKFT